MKNLIPLLLLALALLAAGCEDDATAPPPTPPPNTGSADFTRYVAIGNSLTAGFQSNALSARDQVYAFPYLLARQVQADAQGPLIRDPGIGSRIRLVNLAPTLVNETGVNPFDPASNLNAALPRPYNNLGIPGAVLYDMMDTTGASSNFVSKSIARANPFFAQILRTSLFGNSVYAQARALQPTFISVWIGSNDVLGYATSGGRRGTNVLPPNPQTLPTEPPVFAGWYRTLLDSLKATGAGVITANIPDVTSIPFFTTLGPQIRPRLPAGIPLRYQRNGQTIGLDTTTLSGGGGDPLLLLTGAFYATLLGQPTGRWYRDQGITPPLGIDTTQPFGFHPQNPWPDALTLDSDEHQIAHTAVSDFNAIIDSIAGNRGIGVVNINGVLNTLRTQGYYFPETGTFTTAFILGGAFSYDGVHPSSRGNVLMANAFISVINARFNAQIPPIPITSVPGMPIGKRSGTLPELTMDPWEPAWEGYR